MKTIQLRDYQQMVVLTGAGVSAASGLQTYRGPGGVWAQQELESYGHVEALQTHPAELWQLYGGLRQAIQAAQPNAAHRLLAELEARCQAPQQFVVITQNVDGFHQASGSQAVIELHGNLHYSRCSNPECNSLPFADHKNHQVLPQCELCQALVRPNIVLFGESLEVEKEWQVRNLLRSCDLFLAVGTSGTVWPAANYVRSAKYAGARTVCVNLERNQPANPYFDEEVIGDAGTVLRALFG